MNIRYDQPRRFELFPALPGYYTLEYLGDGEYTKRSIVGWLVRHTLRDDDEKIVCYSRAVPIETHCHASSNDAELLEGATILTPCGQVETEARTYKSIDEWLRDFRDYQEAKRAAG